MKPKIITREAFLIAGVAGSGDETAKVWGTFMKLEKINPIQNQVGEEGYEVRLYPAEGPGRVHVGVQVKDAGVPAEYKVFFVPASKYAEFEIFPAKGYGNSNAEMNRWLEENADTYKEVLLDGVHYAIEVYDKRFKGNDNPESVVGILVPIEKNDVRSVPNFADMIAGPLQELGGRVEEFAGAEIREKVMEGSDDLLISADPLKTAVWMKEAIDRLDKLSHGNAGVNIMTACGRSCQAMNCKETEEEREMRQACATEERYLEKCLSSPIDGVRYERDGNILTQYYTPQQYGMSKYGKGIRCYCSLLGALPEGVNVSPTYCQCSRAFVQAHWEAILGHPVRVELGPTALSGSDECKFIIHLHP